MFNDLLLGIMDLADNYEQRKIDRYEAEDGKICVDTCAISDSDKPYETGVKHPRYNDGQWVIVELYDTPEAAQSGHEKWVKVMTADELPEVLSDVSSSAIAKLIRGRDTRVSARKE